jgi:hypothetical protein
MDEPIYGATTSKDSYELLGVFDSEISRYEAILEYLSSRLNPILQGMGPDVAASHPEEAPIHDLHNSILRVRRLNDRADSLLQRIKL